MEAVTCVRVCVCALLVQRLQTTCCGAGWNMYAPLRGGEAGGWAWLNCASNASTLPDEAGSCRREGSQSQSRTCSALGCACTPVE